MRIVGIVCVIGGWLVAMTGLFVTTANSGRLLFAIGGICLSIFGILGGINKHYVDRAIWKK